MNMKLNKENFIRYVSYQKLWGKAQSLLVAVSGGVDSVVLCDLLQASGFDFEMAHCNFNLRGAESQRDAAFVQQMAVTYNKKLYTTSFDTISIAEKEKTSIEETARNLRYKWFREIAHQQPIATAHHANDNVETVMMNFFRGTGIRGMRGILPIHKDIVRPLLSFTKNEILEYAASNHLNFVEDSSNSSNEYTRNYFRNELLPSIAKVHPAVVENILHNIERHTEVEKIYMDSIAQQKKIVLERKGIETWAPILLMEKLPSKSAFLLEWLMPMGFTAAQLPDIVNLLQATNGKYVASNSHQVFKNRKHLVLAPIDKLEAAHYLIDEDCKELHFEQGHLQFTQSDGIVIEDNKHQALLDAALLEYPLILRKWRMGDYFYPLGMRHKKKLSKFFIDEKLSLTEKQQIWVLESNQKIVWVLGYRIDDRFKIKTNSKHVLKINYSPKTL